MRPIWEWKLVRILRLLIPGLATARGNLKLLQQLSQENGFVNDWLTVTNWVPPVNAPGSHFRLLKPG